MKRNKMLKVVIFSFLLSITTFGSGAYLGYATDYAWDGHWANETAIPYVNGVLGNTVLKSLVNDAALDNWNNNDYTINFFSSNNATGRHILVENVNLSSVTWTGKAEGASYNWDGNNHYYGVNIRLNTAKGILDYSNAKLKGLIAHEFGHALGLEHRTGQDYLMYPYDNRAAYTPNADERQTIYNHYKHQK